MNQNFQQQRGENQGTVLNGIYNTEQGAYDYFRNEVEVNFGHHLQRK